MQRELSISAAELVARRLHSAMEGWGTDEEAIYGALSGRTPTDYQAIKEAYARSTTTRTSTPSSRTS